MNVPDPTDSFRDLLAAYDDALAAGQSPPPAEESSTSLELLARLQKAESCLRRLEGKWPRSEPRGEFPEDMPPDLVLRRLAQAPGTFDHFLVRRVLPAQAPWALALLALDTRRERDVVLKVPRPEDFGTSELRWCFVRGAKRLTGLDHPNLVPVYEAGVVGTVCFVATARREGPTLAAWVREQAQPLPFARAAAVATAAGAVHHAHGRGIIHRGLNPAAIVMAKARDPRPGGAADAGPWAAELGPCRPLVPDFGLIKLLHRDALRSGGVVGDLFYLAPEQVTGKPARVGPTTDVYGLGAVLYELLTGRPPFAGKTGDELRKAIALQDPARPRAWRGDLPRPLEIIVLKCLEKEPAHRYPSALALADDLRCAVEGKPTWARAVGPVRRWWRRWRRKAT